MEKLFTKIRKTVATIDAPYMVGPKPLSQLAQNPIEKSAAIFLQQICIGIPRGIINPRHREFFFHCHLVPAYSLAAIKFVARSEGGPKYWLHEFGCNVLARERMSLEFILRKNPIPGGNLLGTMLTCPEGPKYWQARFDQWHRAAQQSYAYFISRQFPDVRKLNPAQAKAALVGAMEKLSGGLPPKLFSDTLARIESDTSLLTAFTKNATRTRLGRRGQPELDTWLLEIWPLVTEYGWSYHQVWEIAHAKWDSDDECLDSVTRLEDRCKKQLGLRLAPAGKAKRGRPPGISEDSKVPLPPLPPLAALAIGIKSLGATRETWVFGQTNAGE